MQAITIRLKVVIVGEKDVGKSSLIFRQVRDEFHMNTHSVEFMIKSYKVGLTTAKVFIWDWASSDRYSPFRKPFINNSHAICPCFSLNDRPSFQKLPIKLKQIDDLNVDVKGAIYLLGCKSDLPHKVSEVEVMAFAEKERLAYFKCSAKENIGVRESFKIIVEEVASEILKKPEALAKVKIQPQPEPYSPSYCQV